MTEGNGAGDVDPLEVAKASPAAVLRGDKAGWLALFTEDASVEDPVGAGAHRGTARIDAFWDTFIAPQREIRFEPRRDFVHGDQVLRHVTIATVTPVSEDPFRIPAVLDYRVRDGRIASLRAFWEPRRAVSWHAGKGVRGMAGLLRHGARTAGGLGLGSALGFGRSLVPVVSHGKAGEVADGLASACGGAREAWLDFVGDASLSIAPFGGEGPRSTDAEDAWHVAIGRAPFMDAVEIIPAGRFVACVLEANGGVAAAAALVEMDGGRPIHLDLVFAR